MTKTRKWAKRIGLVFFLPILLILIFVLWLGFKYLTYSQTDSKEHLEAKSAYLEQLSTRFGTETTANPSSRPNIVFILYDDMGYGDIGAYGATAIRTPVMDSLAENGVKLTNFYSPSPVCTPARAGLMTGRFPPRAGLSNVVFPSSDRMKMMNILGGDNLRLPAEEITMADMLKAAGYNTGMIGKWHMGDQSPSLPNDMGFNHYFGALYSNDMTPFALYRNTEIEIEAPADQTQLDMHYTREAVNFIADNSSKQQPFFLYFAHNFPHVPLFVESSKEGQSKAGLYGDVVESLDDGVGTIVDALKENNMLENTLIIISSDNGPWWQGDPSSFRGRKGQVFEGGMRVPLIIHWPASLEGGRIIDGMTMGTDLVPTLADWLGLPLPTDRIIDGKSIANMLETGGESPHDYLYYFAHEELIAVRSPTHKYLDDHRIVYHPLNGPIAALKKDGAWFIDLEHDPRESYDASLYNPELAEEMRQVLLMKREEMEENKRGWIDE